MKKAFTLAEVLITLTIIGVVSALTIPALVNLYQKEELKVEFKKVYSTLNQALYQATTDNGGSPYCCYYNTGIGYNTDDCYVFWSNFKSKLKIIKEYSGPADGSTISNYTGVELIEEQGGHNNNSSCIGAKTVQKYSKAAWVLADGSTVFSYSTDFDFPVIIVDINGLKKPNKWGYDLFVLDFRIPIGSAVVSISDGLCGSQEKGGHNIDDILQNK